jgi:uncharacterized protein (DUF924 family)
VAFWETVDTAMKNIFRNDPELRRYADNAVALETANRAAWAGNDMELKYNVDFSA